MITSLLLYGGIAVAAVLTFFGIRKTGVQAQQNSDLRTTLKNVGIRDAVDHEVDGESDADVARDLQRDQQGKQ